MSAEKALQVFETETRKLLGGTEEKSISRNKGSLICPQGKSMIFPKKETEKIELPDLVVLRSGDQNWVSVSRQMKPFAEALRPSDWFSQKNCALQYNLLLEKAEQQV